MKKLLFILLITLPYVSHAQDDLMDLLDDGSDKKQYVPAAFHGSRIILGHSVVTRHKKELEFLISHRFGTINSGSYEFFGLDNAFIRLGLEYGISDNFNVGVGRSSFDKTIDTFLKYRIARQSTGVGSFPFSIVFIHSLAIKTTPRSSDDPTISFSDRLATAHQVLIAHRFNDKLSLQLMPSFVQKNRTQGVDNSDQFALGAGGKVKLTRSVSLNVEYYYRIDEAENSVYNNSFSVGFDIETGGHVFQLHFSNSAMTVERSFITETFGDFFDGDIRFGFNISRTFQLGH
ncbi:MAG TPA: DUF5777 family beta-barrel protein [Fulvivirga sp.]|nr:DUF5777 family beta-barrel protein [Fulvivirga sp.]